ncbi:Protein AAR2 [Thelohanellus kitauei]|uniref:Protein AAR2 homolog n=1 Tax=Thelohanellus kitauei TaxID=669202 RepID=A0A0C2MFX3_THEKT|nr:Protein AAR2 [Thelohanellus kitauei]
MGDCAGLLALNFSLGSIFGIDKNIWKITNNFRGVRAISPGAHYIFYSSVDVKGNISQRKGFIQYFLPGKIYVIVWNEINEDIEQNLSDSDTERLEFQWEEVKGMTAEYPKESNYTWHRLTRYITATSIHRLGLGKERIFIGADREVIATRYEKETEAEKALRKQLNKPENDVNITLRFTMIPKVSHPPNSTGQQISQHYLDKSYTIESLVSTHAFTSDFFGSELISEFQIAFIVFIMGGGKYLINLVYEGFEQWKVLIILFCNCESAIKSHQKLFSAFVETCRYQIEEIPEDFLKDMVFDKNFLKDMLHRLVSRIKKIQGLSSNLQKQNDLLSDILKSSLVVNSGKDQNELKNDDSSEDEDDKPIIVDLGAQTF